MIIPQYSFKLGTQYNKYGKEGQDSLLLLEHSAWNPSNGEWFAHPEERSTSTIMMIGLKSRYLYLDVNITQGKGSYVVFYAEDGSFLSTYWLSVSANKKPILTPEGAKYFALTFSIEDPGLSAYVKDVYTQDKDLYADFVYSLESIKPIYKKLSKKIEKEASQEFFRETLEGEILLTGEDYPKVAGASLETKFILLVFHKETSEITNFFTGYFTKVNCSLDYAKKVCSIKLPKEDAYTSLLARYSETQDLYKLGVPTTKIALLKRPAIQIYVAGSSKITTTLDGTYWESEVAEEQLDETQLDTKYHFVWNGSFHEFSLELFSTGKEIAYFTGSFKNSEHVVYDTTRKYKCKLVVIDEAPYVGVHYNLQVLNAETDELLYKTRNPFKPENPDRFELSASQYELTGSTGISKMAYINVAATNKVYARVICDVDTFMTSEGETRTTYNIPLDDFVLDSRNYKKCYGIVFGDIINTYATSVKPTKYGKNDKNLYFLKPKAQGTNIIPLDQSQWVNAALWYKFSEAYPYLDQAMSKKYYLKDAYHIADAIQAILRKVAPGITHKATPEYSEFLYGQPAGAPRFDLSLFITQKTNVLKGEYDQAAQRAETTLEDLLGMLQKCFKCYFWIEDNKLRIEHTLWFINGGNYIARPEWNQINLLNAQDKFNKKPILFYQSEISYDSLKVPAQYSFSYADEQTEIFNNVSMEIIANYTEPTKIEDTVVNGFAVDLDYMLIYPGNFSEDGFALIGAQLQNDEFICPVVSLDVADEEGNEYRLTTQNGYLSWPELLRYYMYDLPALTIKGQYVKNLQPVGLTKFMQQDITIPKPRNFEYKKAIRTSMGLGSIQSASIDLDSNMLTLSLTYQAE